MSGLKASFSLCLGLLAGSVLAEEGFYSIQSYAVDGNTLLAQEAIARAVAPYTGSNKGRQDVLAAAKAVRDLYAATGYPAVQILIPPQEFQGQAVLKAVEGKIAAIAIWGNTQHDEKNIRNSLRRLLEGQSPNARQLMADINLANENPSKQIAVDLQAGEQPGEIIAKVNVQDRDPGRVTMSLDNGGSPTLGTRRMGLAYQHGNVFNQDHVLTGQVTASPDFPHKNRSASLGYRIPFYQQGVSLDMVGTYTDTASGSTPTPNGVMRFTGAGRTMGVFLNQPLPGEAELRHKLTYGLEYKDFNNSCQADGNGMSAEACGTVTSRPVSITYSSQINLPQAQVGMSIGYAANIPGGPHGGDTYYADMNRKSRWNAWRSSAYVGLPMPQGWQVKISLAAQSSGQRLIPGEQFGAGGASSVRGYAERSITGDQGYTASAELYTPDFGEVIAAENVEARGLVFFDYGRVSDHDASTPNLTLASVGAGLRLNFLKNLALRLDAGRALKPLTGTVPGMGRSRGDTFVHANAVYSY